MEKLQQIIIELQKFDKSLYHFFESVTINEIMDFEEKIGFKLPKDFKGFLLFTDGGDIFNEYIYGIRSHRHLIDLYSNYLIEKDKINNPIPNYLLPISPDGRGNSYCLDLNTLSSNKESCNVVFWQYDYPYAVDDKPDIDSNSFSEFLEELLKNLKNNYNYDGTEKIK